jgi:hypothetical protein
MYLWVMRTDKKRTRTDKIPGPNTAKIQRLERVLVRGHRNRGGAYLGDRPGYRQTKNEKLFRAKNINGKKSAGRTCDMTVFDCPVAVCKLAVIYRMYKY